MNALRYEVRKVEWKKLSNTTVQMNVSVTAHAAEGRGFEHQIVYTVYGNGWIDVTNSVRPFGELPFLPKLGVTMALREGLEHYRWFGRGPHENYPDRKTSTPMGFYESTVSNQYFPRLQETGNHENVRWFTLTNDAGSGVLIVPGSPMSVTALHFSVQDLESARHINELNPRKEIFLSIDAKQHGLGNASCGPGTIEAYCLKPGPVEFSYCIRPYTPAMGDPAILGRNPTPLASRGK